MYKPPTEPIRCPKCGAIVKVTAIRFPDIEWKCLMCGESGSIKQGATSGYIQKVSEPDPGVGVTTTNATGDGYNTINAVPSIYSPMTECEICGEEFKFDSRSYICPKCREAIVKLRGTADSTANAMPTDKSTANAVPADNKSTVTDSKSTACDIPAPKWIQQGWQCPKCGAILAPNQSYCPFCSPSEYGRSNWVGPTCGEWTNTPMSGQYTNPNPSTTISLGDKPKTPVSDNIIFTTHCDNIKVTQ